jgi:hypothetical protein
MGFAKQVELYEEMLKQAKILLEAVQEGHEEKIKGTLARRQELMKEIDEINSRLHPVMTEICQTLHFPEFKVSKLREVVHTPGSERVAAAIEALASLLPEIQRVDTEMENLAQERILRLKADLKSLREANSVRNAYHDNDWRQEPELFDKKK